MTHGDDKLKKIEQLRNAITETKSIAPKLIDKGRNLAEAGQSALDLANALEPLAKNVPDGFSSPMIDHVSGGLREFNAVAQEQYKTITLDTSLLLLSHANVTNTTVSVTASFDIDIPFGTPDATAFSESLRPLLGLLHRNSDVEAVKRSMKALGLDVAHGSIRAPLQLVQSAEDAFRRPSSDEGYANAVLIPLRESIQASIEELLKRRQVVEKTGSWVKKITSIGEHCGKNSLSPDYINRVAATTHTLIDKLSGSKDQHINREQTATLFDQGVSLLQDIFSLIDSTKFRA